MDLSDLRENYTKDGLEREMLDVSPFGQFEHWFKQAMDVKLPEPNAMTLSTATASGRPRARVVLLKAFDARGLVFYTNFESKKARHIDENPQVSANFFWEGLQRQVIIEGRAERVPTSESLRYFASRPFGSRLGAWTSPQSKIITSRKLLEMKFSEMREKFSQGEVPLPKFWGGFRIVPDLFEFWQGRPNRLHDRFQYILEDGNWRIDRLAP